MSIMHFWNAFEEMHFFKNEDEAEKKMLRLIHNGNEYYV